jgi:hypothetical protein
MNSEVLFITHKIHNCGVYQYGKRVYDILKNENKLNYKWVEIEEYSEYLLALSSGNYSAIIYNYHDSVMTWLTTNTIQRVVKNIGIIHESRDTLFDVVISISDYSIPRPIFENKIIKTQNKNISDFIYKYTDTEIKIFGSFGFGFENKGFTKIIQYVNDQYDTAVIKLVIPLAHFDPENDKTHTNMYNACMNVPRKPGIDVMITHDFFTNDELLEFLSTNTMNVFMYDYMGNRGISSTIDYALSVKKPLGISDSYMFRNIYSDEICLYRSSIADILENSVKYCSKFLDLYSNQNLIDKFYKVVSGISYSQCLQDRFVKYILKDKRDGYFLEIGSNHYCTHNNTFSLESVNNWKGALVEYDQSFEEGYKNNRKNSIYRIGDAQKVDYLDLLKDFPVNIDYLQIDLDVNNKSTLNTLSLLNETVFDKYKFATVTFEHDIYTGNYFDTQESSRKIFTDRGYVLLFSNVSVFWEGSYKPFEDWYVHPDLVDPEFLKLKGSGDYFNLLNLFGAAK